MVSLPSHVKLMGPLFIGTLCIPAVDRSRVMVQLFYARASNLLSRSR